MNSDTEAGTTSGAEHIATFLNSCRHHEAKEDDVLGLSEFLLTRAMGEHDAAEEAGKTAADTESKNAFEQHSSTIADQPESLDCCDELLASVLNENDCSPAEASADGHEDGNSTDSKLLMTS